MTRLAHPLVLIAGLYVAASLAIQHRVVADLFGSTAGWVASDSDLFIWWLKWVPWALLHGHNPLLTDYQHYPVGVNAMWNTAVPVLGVVLAPLTLTLGPVAAYNIGMLLGPVVSGMALVLALHPYTVRWTSRAVAGGAYAFGPFMLAHLSVGHLNLVWAVLPPILLYAVHAIFVREQRRPLRAGMLLGVALAVQTVLYTQTVAVGALMLAVAAVLLAIRWPRVAWRRLPNVSVAAAGCLLSYAALCAYPFYLLLAGPARPRGAIRTPGYFVTDLANVLIPTNVTHFQLGASHLATELRAYSGEQGGYLGVGLVALLVAAVLAVRRSAVRVTAAVGLVALVLSCGPSLVVLGTDTGVPLPWRIFEWVPLIGQLEPVRLQICVDLCVAVIVALLLDRVGELRRSSVRLTAFALSGVALVTWTPANSQESRPADVPQFFPNARSQLRSGDVVETVPRASGIWATGGFPLLWQAVSGMSYRTTGGYFIGSDAQHDVLLETPPNSYQTGCAAIMSGQPAPDQGDAVAAAQELRSQGVTVVVVVVGNGADSPVLLDWTRLVTGTTGYHDDDVWVFRIAQPVPH